MLIQRILEDPSGTIVNMGGGSRYHFKPRQPDGPHVCEVTDEAHIERFLSIPEGYRPAPEQAAGGVPILKTPGGMTIDADGNAYFPPIQLGAAKPDGQAEVGIPTTPTEPSEATVPVEPPAAAGWDAVADDQLRAIFEQEIGRKPHHRASRETMIAQVEAKRQGE